MTNFTVDGLDHVHVAVRDRRAAELTTYDPVAVEGSGAIG